MGATVDEPWTSTLPLTLAGVDAGGVVAGGVVAGGVVAPAEGVAAAGVDGEVVVAVLGRVVAPGPAHAARSSPAAIAKLANLVFTRLSPLMMDSCGLSVVQLDQQFVGASLTSR